MKYKKTTDYNSKNIVDEYKVGSFILEKIDIPETLKLVGKNIKNKKILDLGCGDGSFTYKLHKLGADSVGIDNSETFLMDAIKDYPEVSFLHMDGSNMRKLKNNTFDLIVMRMVLVNISDISTIKKIFKECSRILKKNGKLIFSIHHPLMIQNFKDSYRKVVIPKNGSYSKVGMIYKLQLLFLNGKFFKFDACHWPIEFLITELKNNNLFIDDISTPIPNEKSRGMQLKSFSIIPHFMFISAIKK